MVGVRVVAWLVLVGFGGWLGWFWWLGVKVVGFGWFWWLVGFSRWVFPANFRVICVN